MIWWYGYLIFCIITFVLLCYGQYKFNASLTWGDVILLFVASLIPCINGLILLWCVVVFLCHIWDKEVFK